MANMDFTNCNGKGCVLRETCRRYVDGQTIRVSREEGQHYWLDNCNEETREAYIKI